MYSFTQSLARLAKETIFSDLPDDVIYWASRAFTDTVGCAIAGSGEAVVTTLASIIPAAAGPSMVFGQKNRLHPLDAAQLNGVSAHALDFDDCNLEMDGHPSVSIVPALLAIADKLDCSGKELLAAYIVGVEAEIRLARASNPAHANRGWHPTVTFGVIGSAVACAHLLKLDERQMATAIGIAASSASGLRANSGTMTKPFHAGQANRNGLQAAMLAQAGMTANLSALEHRFGFMAAFNGEITKDAKNILSDWGTNYAILSPGIAIKQYPCCAFIHCVIDSGIQLHGKITGSKIKSVAVSVHQKRLKNIDRPNPSDGLDAKFSTQYLAARALLNGAVVLDSFSHEQVFDKTCAALAGKVVIEPHQMDDLSFGSVKITLEDGRVLEASASIAMGRGPSSPMSEEQFSSKFINCATVNLTPSKARDLLDALLNMPAQKSATKLIAQMQPNSLPFQSPDVTSHLAKTK